MFRIETGEGILNSNTYALYEDFMEYVSIRAGFEDVDGQNGIVYDEQHVNKYLVAASDKLDTLSWSGRKANPRQSMQWPRYGATNICDNCCECYPSDVVPNEIREATIILAFMMITGQVSMSRQETNPLVKSISLEGQRIEFVNGARISSGGPSDDCGGDMGTVSGDYYKSVRHLIKCFMKRSRPQIKLIRG